MSNSSSNPFKSMVFGPVNKRWYIINKESYEYFLKSSVHIIGQLKGEEEYYVISKETHNLFQNDQQSWGPIKYQNNEIYIVNNGVIASKKIPFNKVMRRIYISEEYYAINEENYKEYLSHKKNLQLQQLMQRLVRDNTEYYITNRENYEFISEITQTLRKKTDIIDEELVEISKIAYDGYLLIQTNPIKEFLRQLVQQHVCNGSNYLISDENYKNFIAKIPVLQQQVKGYVTNKGLYFKIDKETYNNHLQNDQQNPDDLLFMQHVIGQLNFLDKECYVIDEENYEYFSKFSQQQPEGRVKINEVYYVINKRTYERILRENNSGYLRRQILGPVNGESYIINEAYGKFLNGKQTTRRLTIKKEYYIIDKEAYDRIRLQHFVRRLVRPINLNNTEYYVTNTKNHNFISEIIHPSSMGKLELEVDYYTLKKGKFRNYFQHDQQVQNFMQQFTFEINNGEFISKDNYDHFLKQIIARKDVKLAKFTELYCNITEEAYHKHLNPGQQQVQTPEQQDDLESILRKFMKQQVFGQLYYSGCECYVVGKEIYIKFLERIQEFSDKEKENFLRRSVRGPINTDYAECYIIIKETYENYFGSVEFNSRNNAKSKELNDLEEKYKNLSKENVVLQTKYQSLEQNVHNNIQSLEKEHQNLVKVLRTQNQTLEEKVKTYNDLETQNQMLEGKHQNLVKAHNELRTRSRALEEKNQGWLKTRKDLETQNQVLEGSNQSLVKARDSFRSRSQTLEEKNQGLLKTRKDLETRNQTLEGKHQNLVKANNELQSQNQALEEKHQKVNNELQSRIKMLEKECGNLKVHNTDLTEKVTEYQLTLSDVTDNYNYNLGSVKSNSRNNTNTEELNDIQFQIQTLEGACQKLKKSYNNYLENNSRNNTSNKELILYDSSNNTSGKELNLNKLQLRNQTLEEECERLKVQNSNLKVEAIKYQSALGDATTFHLGSQDSNNTNQLSNDIRDLHYKLERFCSVKKGAYINRSEVENLSKKYNCSIAVEISKNLICGLLERAVIETIIEKTEEYLDCEKFYENIYEESDGRKRPNFEAEIVNTTEKLLEMTESFSRIRTGIDRVSEAVPTKVRQQIYSILGNRGFSKTYEDDEEQHPFIVKLRDDILQLMTRYRKFRDTKKFEDSMKSIDGIIREIIVIFFFRLRVQEPIATWSWLPKGMETNTLRMEASWDTDDTELRFDVCAFPLIGSNLLQASEKVIFPAQVVVNTIE